MTGESLLHLYVYGLAFAFLAWTLLMGWMVTRSARRLLRRERSLAAAQGLAGAQGGSVPSVRNVPNEPARSAG